MQNGFEVEVENLNSLERIKAKYQIPEPLESCHTAIVDGYVIEGHVPAADINRLLEEKPPVLGIAVAGMPVGSPGMEIEGFETQPFDVVTFDKDGVIEIFSSYSAH
ncbi:MAG: DUF411 domain-containing protein [Anaerolineales bacterium]